MGTGYVATELPISGELAEAERYTGGPRRNPVDILLERFNRDVAAMHHLVYWQLDEEPAGVVEGEPIAEELLAQGIDPDHEARDLVFSLYYFTPEMAHSRALDAIYTADWVSNALLRRSIALYRVEHEGAPDDKEHIWPGLDDGSIEVIEAYLKGFDGEGESKVSSMRLDDIARFVYGLNESVDPEAHLYEIEGSNALVVARARELVRLTTSRLALGISALGGTFEGDVWQDTPEDMLPLVKDFYVRTVPPNNIEAAVKYIIGIDAYQKNGEET